MYELIKKVIWHRYPSFIRDEDVLQAGAVGWVKAYNNYDSTKGSFEAYAYSCIRNEIRAHFKRELKEQYDVCENIEVAVDGWEDDVEFELAMMELGDRAWQICQLKLDGQTNKQIADKLGLSVGDVVKELYQIKGTLERRRRHCEM